MESAYNKNEVIKMIEACWNFPPFDTFVENKQIELGKDCSCELVKSEWLCEIRKKFPSFQPKRSPESQIFILETFDSYFHDLKIHLIGKFNEIYGEFKKLEDKVESLFKELGPNSFKLCMAVSQTITAEENKEETFKAHIKSIKFLLRESKEI